MDDDSGSEADSTDFEREQEGYNSEESVEEINTKFNELLIDKFRLITAFNGGTMSVTTYLINMSRINREMNETEFDRDQVEHNLADKEIELNLLLNTYENKIKQQVQNLSEKEKKDSLKNILSKTEKEAMDNIREALNIVKNKSKVVEEDDEPLPSNRLFEEWDNLSAVEKVKIIQITGLVYPEKTDFKNFKEYEKAQDDFLDNISIFLSSYWRPFEVSEEKELLTLAKKHHEKIPSKDSPYYHSFLNNIAQKYLDYGYTYSTGTTKAKGVYEKVEMKLMKDRVKELMEKQKELPIQLKPDEQLYSEQIKFYHSLLNKLTDDELRSCILNKVSGIELPKNLSPEQRKFYEVLKKYPPPPKFVEQIAKREEVIAGRNLSKRKLEKIFKDIPIVLKRYIKEDNSVVDNVSIKVEKLEDCIFRLTKKSPAEYFTKINDIVFIFEHYPDFKIKFLQGWIGILQLVLFENLLLQKGVIEVYPVSVKGRKTVIQQIIKEIFFSTYDIPRLRLSEILTKVLIKHKAKELERFIFDLAQNNRDYSLKIKQLLQFIKKNGTDIFLPIEELLKRLNQRQIKTEIDYNRLNINEIKALLLQEQYHLQELEKKKQILASKNYTGNYAIFWELPDIISSVQKEQWAALIEKIKQTPLKEGLINELNKLRFYLIKQYKLDFIPGQTEIVKSISSIEEKIKKISSIYLKAQFDEIDRQRKLNPQIQQQQIPQQQVYPLINEFMIGQLVNSIKRKNLNTIRKINIDLLELYDINELNKINHITSVEVYNKIKNYLITELNKYGANFNLINRTETEKIINQINKSASVIEITTSDAAIKQLAAQWPKIWNGENIKDYYGENVFEKLTKINNPFDFYNREAIRKYDSLVKQNIPPTQTVYTRPQALFDGKWYNVEYLDKDWGTGEPLSMIKEELVKNPRTKLFEVVKKTAVRRGKVPFILRTLRTDQEGKTKEVWTEVSQGQITYRSPSFGKAKLKKRLN